MTRPSAPASQRTSSWRGRSSLRAVTVIPSRRCGGKAKTDTATKQFRRVFFRTATERVRSGEPQAESREPYYVRTLLVEFGTQSTPVSSRHPWRPDVLGL